MFRRSKKQVAKHQKLQGWGVQPTPDQGLSQKALTELESKIQGSVTLPSDPTYNNDRQETNPAFQTFPQLIVYCEVFNDVRECLKFAHENQLWVTCRSGGHSTAGYSVNTGMVIDTSKMRYAVVDPRKKEAIVGAGTNFGTLNATLNDYKLHVPSGGCEDVCIAGYMQGGGYGFTSREHGIHCDNVLEVTVMLYDGRIVVANEKQNSDLWWATRGGTGNNFGVLLQVKYRLYDLWQVWGYGLEWTIEDAPPALLAMQQGYMKSGAPPQLGFMTFICYQSKKPVLLMRGMFNGSRDDGMKALKALLDTKGCKLQVDRSGSYQDMNRYLLEMPPGIPDCPDLAREDKQSGFIARPLELADWKKICDKFLETPNVWTTIVIEPYGGKINATPAGTNAFIHRDADMDFFMDVFWMNEEQNVAAVRYLDEYMAMMAPYMNGHAYQNYPRASQKNYRWLYWGRWFNKLLAIKQKYDPTDFFHYQQSISPYPDDDPTLTRDPTPPENAAAEPIMCESYSSSVLEKP